MESVIVKFMEGFTANMETATVNMGKCTPVMELGARSDGTRKAVYGDAWDWCRR